MPQQCRDLSLIHIQHHPFHSHRSFALTFELLRRKKRRTDNYNELDIEGRGLERWLVGTESHTWHWKRSRGMFQLTHRITEGITVVPVLTWQHNTTAYNWCSTQYLVNALQYSILQCLMGQLTADMVLLKWAVYLKSLRSLPGLHKLTHCPIIFPWSFWYFSTIIIIKENKLSHWRPVSTKIFSLEMCFNIDNRLGNHSLSPV